MRGLLYISCVYTGSIVGLATQLFAGLAIGNTVGIKGVANCAGPLQAILTVPIV